MRRACRSRSASCAPSRQLPPRSSDGAVVPGERSLDGALRHARGLLATVIVAREAGLVGGVEVVAAASLAGLVDLCRSDAPHGLDGGAPLHSVDALRAHSSIAVTGRHAHGRPSDSRAGYRGIPGGSEPRRRRKTVTHPSCPRSRL